MYKNQIDENRVENKIPSNEEIIDYLTENLTDSCNMSDAKITNDNSENNSANITLTEHSDVECKENVLPENTDMEDELSLKERDAKLTEQQKTELMEKSQIYKNEGNEKYKDGDYENSILSYTKGLRICPINFSNERSIMYSNRAASKFKLALKESAINDCSKAIELNPNYLKVYLRRAKLYEEENKLEEALQDYNKILELDRTNKDAITAAMRLPDQIKEKNEKLKEEMLGKLKDLGNTVLRPFGLSTNNFKMTQNPDTGGYSINFVQNSN